MDKPRIGWIGTGVMGSSMAGHLMDAGYTVSVFNRTVSKTKTLVDKGAKLCASPKEVGENSDIVFSIVGYPKDVESVLAGEDGALSGMAKGGIICDMTTSSPSLAVKLAEKAAGQGIISLDAPVTGGDVGARKATLSIFVGGAQEGFDRVLPLLQIMGQKIMHCGEAGMGHQAKMANKVAVAGLMFSVCESLIYAAKAGLDVRKWHELVSVGAAGSVPMQTLAPRMMDGDFEPGFFIDHFVKDLGLVLEECRRIGIVLPGATLADSFYRSMQGQGFGKKGTQALIQALCAFSGTTWEPIPKA